MSLDFHPPNNHYQPHDIDQPFPIHNQDNPTAASPAHPHLTPAHLQHHPFDQPEGMDTNDHPSYGLFNNEATSPTAFTSGRYRTNASSSSSLNHGFGMNSESIYSQESFAGSVPSFNGSNGSNPYDLITNFSSGKVSPHTPSDSVTSLHHPAGFPPSIAGKDYPPQGYDMHESRRLPASNGYSNDYPDDYSIGGMNNNVPFGSGGIQPFDRRYGPGPQDRYAHNNAPSNGLPHMSNGHGSDMRGVAPHATLPFRESPVSPYGDEMPYMAGHQYGPETRLHAVDEAIARMKLGHPQMMGASNDLQTFIRYCAFFRLLSTSL